MGGSSRSTASNLVPGDGNDVLDVFLRDRQTGDTELISIAPDATVGNSESAEPVVSSGGRYVAFWGGATNLVPGMLAASAHVFRRDRVSGTTEIVSLTNDGAVPSVRSYSFAPAISADGRYVASWSHADLVLTDANDDFDIYLRDLVADTTELISAMNPGGQFPSVPKVPAISSDGRYIAFEHRAKLTPENDNDVYDVFVYDW